MAGGEVNPFLEQFRATYGTNGPLAEGHKNIVNHRARDVLFEPMWSLHS